MSWKPKNIVQKKWMLTGNLWHMALSSRVSKPRGTAHCFRNRTDSSNVRPWLYRIPTSKAPRIGVCQYDVSNISESYTLASDGLTYIITRLGRLKIFRGKWHFLIYSGPILHLDSGTLCPYKDIDRFIQDAKKDLGRIGQYKITWQRYKDKTSGQNTKLIHIVSAMLIVALAYKTQQNYTDKPRQDAHKEVIGKYGPEGFNPPCINNAIELEPWDLGRRHQGFEDNQFQILSLAWQLCDTKCKIPEDVTTQASWI